MVNITFTAINAGELIKASVANANWRHVGRLGADMLPQTTAGASVDDTWSLGSLTYQWKDLYLSATGKIYVGGVEFTGGGGGGSAGLDIIATANKLEKLGITYPLTSANILRNALTSDKQIVLYMRKDYNTADTTTMVADHGLASELRTINNFETFGDFTAGTNTPTLANDTTDFLEGTQSIKMTTGLTVGDHDFYETVTESFTGLLDRVSLYPNTLANVTQAYVILYTSAGNQRRFNFPVAQLTATTWNHLTCDINDSSAYTDTGTFERSDVTRIVYGATTSGAQILAWSWDLNRSISDQPLLVPNYGLTLSVQDATNQDTFTLLSEDLTDNTTKGTYTLAATLGDNYTNDESTAYASSTTGNISNNQMTHKSTASGQNAQTAKQHDILELSTTLSSGTLEAFVRFYDDSFEVDSFPTTGTINLKENSAAATEKLRFLDNDWVLLFKKLRAGRNDQSMEGTHSVNYIRLQLNANAGDSSSLITLSHDGSNSVGSDVTGYYVVPESAYIEYIAGAKNASTVTRPTPTELLINGNGSFIFEDSFNYADKMTTAAETLALYNDWYAWSNSSAASCRAGIKDAAIYQEDVTTNVTTATSVYRQLELIPNQETEITYNFNISALENAWYWGIVVNGVSTNYNDTDSSHVDGIYCNLYSTGTTTIAVKLGDSSGELVSTNTTIATSTDFMVRIRIKKDSIFYKVWDSSTAEPAAWTTTAARSGGLTFSGNYFKVGSASVSGAAGTVAIYTDDLIIKNTVSYTVKYSVSDLTNIDKLETIKTLTRSDTVNQNPVYYESGSILF